MGRFLTLTVLLVLGALAVRTQQPYLTDGMGNGVLWRDLSHLQKVSYVTGATDGMEREYFHIVAQQGNRPSLPFWFGRGGTMDVVREMDSFYQDGSNISRPMITAFEYSAMKLAGDTKEQLDSYLTRFK